LLPDHRAAIEGERVAGLFQAKTGAIRPFFLETVHGFEQATTFSTRWCWFSDRWRA
jgi:hypothetical protein